MQSRRYSRSSHKIDFCFCLCTKWRYRLIIGLLRSKNTAGMSGTKKSKSSVFDFFSLSDDQKQFLCQCVTYNKDEEIACNVKISNSTAGTSKANAPSRASNLKRHLKYRHPDIFDKVTKQDEERQQQQQTQASSSNSRQSSMSSYISIESSKLTISMSKEKFKDYLVQMVVHNSIPLRFFSSAAFLGLAGEIAKKLGVSLQRDSIRDLVLQKALSEKKIVKKAIKEANFVFLKMDSCTRLRINYFAVNAQFINNNNEIVLYTLAVRDTNAEHTSDSIQALLRDILREYELKKPKVLCIVSDNATNMIKAVDKLNQSASQSGHQDCNNPLTVTIEVDEDDGSESDDESGDQSDETENDTFNELDMLFALAAVDVTTTEHMRCAVHTFQLCIRDGLKARNIANLLAHVRKVVAAARTPKVEAVLKRRCNKGAVLDQATRWGSTYLMLQRLLELKSCLIDMANPDVSLTDQQWKQVQEIESLLQHLYAVTKNLQSNDLTPGSFFKQWKMILFRLSQTDGSLARDVLQSMQRREQLLLQNKILVAGIYVDPRYRILLNEEEQECARKTLWDLSVRQRTQEESDELEIVEVETSSRPELAIQEIVESESSSTSSEDDFEKMLDEREQAKRRCTERDAIVSPQLTDIAQRKKDFSQALLEVENFDRSKKLSVMDALPSYPEIIQKVAYAVTALPTTQVSVERLFSSLRIIKSDLRNRLGEDLINAILFLRTNWTGPGL